MRCFIAVDIPENIKSKINFYLSELEKINHENRIIWIKKQNIHLTVQFIGEIGEHKVKNLIKRLKNMQFEPFFVEFDNAATFFPNEKHPKVIKLKIIDKKRKLIELNEKIRKTLNDLSIDYDKKPFSAHLTLGRIKYLSGNFKKTYPINLPRLRINNIQLLRSSLTKNGPIYSKPK